MKYANFWEFTPWKSKLENTTYNDDIRLHRDDGLKVSTNRQDQQKRYFKTLGFQVDLKINLHKVNFLDTFKLRSGIYRPYKKPNNKLLYIYTLSNDSPLIIRQLPRSTNKRLSGNFSNKTVSESTKSEYRDALKSGFKSILKYKPKNTPRKNRNRRRNIIWFNSLFNKNATTFFRLLDKHFPISNRLHKIFDRNTVKVSYSCMKNVSQIIRR